VAYPALYFSYRHIFFEARQTFISGIFLTALYSIGTNLSMNYSQHIGDFSKIHAAPCRPQPPSPDGFVRKGQAPAAASGFVTPGEGLYLRNKNGY
jgi:hypothetical protein